MEAASPTPLSGPEVVTIKAISWLGPFAANHTVKIGTAEVPVVNGGTREVSVTAISLDPVRISGRGVAARNGGKLEVAANTKVLAPGTAAKILIWGTMPALPGSYSSVLRVQTACGESLAVPVNFAVASSPAWGIGCMLLGLCMMGIISVLAGESDVQSRLRDVLRFRQEAHERLEQTPPPESRAMDVLAMDRDIAAAVAALSRPRGWTFVDHRIGDANERFQSARDKEAALRNSVAGQVPAGLELQELERDWRAFQDHMASIRKRLEETGSTAKLDGLGGAVNDFLGHFAQAYLGVPLTVLGEQIAPQVIRAELALDSGRSTEAAAMAAIVRRSLRRVASTVDQRLSLVLGYYAEGLGMVLDDARIRQRVGADAVKDPDRGTVLGPLDQAAEGLQNDRSLSAFAAAHRRVVDAGTALLRAERTIAVDRVNAALAASKAETDIDDVMQAGGEIPEKPDETARRAYMLRIVDGWRLHLHGVPDANQREGLLSKVDALDQALHEPDLHAAAAPLKALQSAWSEYVPQRLAQISEAVMSPICEGWRADLRLQLDRIEQKMRLLGPTSASADWDSRLGQLRLSQLRIRHGDCDAVLALGRPTLALDQEVFAAALADVPIPPDAKLGAAELSEVADAIKLAQRLLNGPRPLTFTILTPVEERYAGRQIVFQYGNFDPVWQAGVKVGFDFADGQAPTIIGTEELRQQGNMTHTFEKAVTGTMQIAVATAFRPGTLSPEETLLGSGEASLFVLPSPASAARRLADIFFNTRFILALAIAGTVYYWQFEARDRVFGTRGFDYVQAFALGFVVDAAVADLPTAIAKIVG